MALQAFMRIYRDSEGVLQVVGLGSSGPCIFRLYKGCKGNLRVIRVPYGFKVLGIRIHAPHHMYFGFESSEVAGRYFREGFTSLGSCTATRAFSSATTLPCSQGCDNKQARPRTSRSETT